MESFNRNTTYVAVIRMEGYMMVSTLIFCQEGAFVNAKHFTSFFFPPFSLSTLSNAAHASYPNLRYVAYT